MVAVIAGLTAFVLFILYDLNSITKKNSLIQKFFILGVFLITLSTGFLIRSYAFGLSFTFPRFICLASGLIFLALLYYTLFLALPFEATYLQENHLRPACTDGVYALCRHPGAIWFSGFYLSLSIYTCSRIVWLYSALVSLGNLLYILFQDRVSFPKTFTNYDIYRNTTPFLFPNKRSISACINSMRKRGDLP